MELSYLRGAIGALPSCSGAGGQVRHTHPSARPGVSPSGVDLWQVHVHAHHRLGCGGLAAGHLRGLSSALSLPSGGASWDCPQHTCP